jgi:hypothetical protein
MDRHAVAAVAELIDRKHALGPEPNDPGFDNSVLPESWGSAGQQRSVPARLRPVGADNLCDVR